MTNAVPDPASELLATAQRHSADWLRRLAAEVTGPDGDDREPTIETVVVEAAATLMSDLATLLATDVDEQQTNPLTLFRSATVPVTRWLVERGYPPRARDRFDVERFPGDAYGFMPATWEDIHPELVTVGLTWGAWKAMTVIGRRRGR